MKHDAYRQVGYIQQALSQNRKSIGIFLGAGCPLGVEIEYPYSEIRTKKGYKFPIIPDVAGLTKIITEKLKRTVYETGNDLKKYAISRCQNWPVF